jgi:hypothetical protein
MLITVNNERTSYTPETMSQYHIPIHLPLPSPSSNPATLPERSSSVSTISTIGSPFSQTPAPHLVATLPSQLHSPSPSQELTPTFPSVLDSNLYLSARKLKSEFHRRDINFARLIVAILAQRIEMGILAPVNGIGFPFTEKDERRVNFWNDGLTLEIMQVFRMGCRVGIQCAWI